MYIGNGVTKKFPLPEGYDGSVVVLKMQNGKSVRMTEGEGYIIKDNSVNFYAPVPAGIEISFDVPDENELMKKNTSNYVVIYSDGSMREVDEDPTLILTEAQNILREAKNEADEIKEAVSNAKEYMTSMLNSSGADLDGRLDGYSVKVEEMINDAAHATKQTILNEWLSTLDRLNAESKSIREDLSELQKIKKEIQNSVDTTAENFKNEILSQCEEVFTKYEEIKKIRPELEIYSLELKGELKQIMLETSDEMRIKINEEVEFLRNLRTKMEEDFNTLNTKINNRWEMLRSEIDA